ncbi:MAG: RluA family pseudouridine synthase [Coprobacillus sp.]|nr:RluA family pseudouridine synthase [Coprobacillus sp.]
MERVKVDDYLKDMRIDKALALSFPNMSRSSIATLIKEGGVLVNDTKVKPSYITKLDDEISVEEVEKEVTLLKEDIPLNIVYEDDDIIIVDKPQGMVVHPGISNETHTMANALAYHFAQLSTLNGDLRPGIVHRIDKDTSGLVCVAKNDYAHAFLSQQLEDHTMRRSYYALVRGNIKENKAKIDLPIDKDKKYPMKQAVVRGGKSAVTYFEVVKRYKSHTLIKCDLETGRTHQIRVHLAYLGYPIESDPLYGEKNVKPLSPNGQMLHAYQLTLVHPTTKEEMTFNSPLPEYFKNILDSLEPFNSD